MASNSDDWIAVPIEIAKLHPLYGVGGWLILISIGCVWTVVGVAPGAFTMFSGVDYAALNPTLAAFVLVELFGNATIVLWAVGNLFMIFAKNPFFPKSFAAYLAFASIFLIADSVAAPLIFDVAGLTYQEDEKARFQAIGEIVRSVIGAAIWIPYSFMSARVNVTFLNRVRRDDPIIRDKFAEIF